MIPTEVPPLHIRIVSPKEIIFEGFANSVSSTNVSGKFDILPFHANFISLIENTPITIRKTDGQIAEYTFPMAIIYQSQNNVNIYTDIRIEKSPDISTPATTASA